MKINEILERLKTKGAILQGTTRPQHNRQLDFWQIGQFRVLITTTNHWSSGERTAGGEVSHTYRESEIVRVQQLIDITEW